MSFYRAILVVTLLLFASPVVAGDATSFDPTPIPVAAQAQAGVPIGTVIAWPKGSLPPSSSGVVPSQGACVAAVSTTQVESLGCEWLEADGSPISPAAYPELSAVVGGVLPDYRGVFLRGHGAVTSSHYGVVTHQSGALGVLQGDAIREISGDTSGTANRGVFGNSNQGAFYTDGSAHGPSRDGDWSQRNSLHFRASRSTPVASEIRPINRAVVYLIRAR